MREITSYLQWENNLNDSKFLIRSYECQKKVVHHFSNDSEINTYHEKKSFGHLWVAAKIIHMLPFIRMVMTNSEHSGHNITLLASIFHLKIITDQPTGPEINPINKLSYDWKQTLYFCGKKKKEM